MKHSKKVRWILVLPAIVFVFFCVGNLFEALFGRGDKLAFVMSCLFTFLAGVIVAPLRGKRFVIVIASLFILTCFFPPWRATNGNRHSMGYALIFNPPQTLADKFTSGYVAQIDFGRLFFEWAALAAVGGMGWVLVVKRNSPLDGKTNRLQKFPPPPSNSKN